MAFSTQKEFFNVQNINEASANDAAKSKLKTYTSNTDDRTWVSDDSQKSKYMQDLLSSGDSGTPISEAGRVLRGKLVGKGIIGETWGRGGHGDGSGGGGGANRSRSVAKASNVFNEIISGGKRRGSSYDREGPSSDIKEGRCVGGMSSMASDGSAEFSPAQSKLIKENKKLKEKVAELEEAILSSANLNQSQAGYISELEREIQSMQKYYEDELEKFKFGEEILNCRCEELRERVLQSSVDADRCQILEFENDALRDDLRKRDNAINAYDSQFQQLMGVIDELSNKYGNFERPVPTKDKTAEEVGDDVVFYMGATIEYILQEINEHVEAVKEVVKDDPKRPSRGDTDSKRPSEVSTLNDCLKELQRLKILCKDQKIQLEESESYLENKQEQWKKKVEDLEQENICLCEAFEERTREADNYKQEVDDLHNVNVCLCKAAEQHGQRIDDMGKKLENLEKDISKNGDDTRSMDSSLRKSIDLVKQISEVTMENEKLNKEMNDIKDKEALDQIEKLKNQIKELEKSNQCLCDDLEEEKKRPKDADKEIERLKKLLKECQKEKDKLEELNLCLCDELDQEKKRTKGEEGKPKKKGDKDHRPSDVSVAKEKGKKKPGLEGVEASSSEESLVSGKEPGKGKVKDKGKKQSVVDKLKEAMTDEMKKIKKEKKDKDGTGADVSDSEEEEDGVAGVKKKKDGTTKQKTKGAVSEDGKDVSSLEEDEDGITTEKGKDGTRVGKKKAEKGKDSTTAEEGEDGVTEGGKDVTGAKKKKDDITAGKVKDSVSEKDKDAASADKRKDGTGADKDEDTAVGEKGKEATAAEKAKQAGAAEKRKDGTGADKDEDTAVGEKGKDGSAAEKAKQAGVAEKRKDSTGADKDEDTAVGEKGKDGSAAEKAKQAGADKGKDAAAADKGKDAGAVDAAKPGAGPAGAGAADASKPGAGPAGAGAADASKPGAGPAGTAAADGAKPGAGPPGTAAADAAKPGAGTAGAADAAKPGAGRTGTGAADASKPGAGAADEGKPGAGPAGAAAADAAKRGAGPAGAAAADAAKPGAGTAGSADAAKPGAADAGKPGAGPAGPGAGPAGAGAGPGDGPGTGPGVGPAGAGAGPAGVGAGPAGADETRPGAGPAGAARAGSGPAGAARAGSGPAGAGAGAGAGAVDASKQGGRGGVGPGGDKAARGPGRGTSSAQGEGVGSKLGTSGFGVGKRPAGASKVRPGFEKGYQSGEGGIGGARGPGQVGIGPRTGAKKRGGRGGVGEMDDDLLDEFVERTAMGLGADAIDGVALERELRKILDTFIDECGFCFCKCKIPKSRFYSICHKLYHSGLHTLEFRELAYMHKKIFNAAESILPGCLFNMILKDMESFFKVPTLKQCCTCKNNLCCDASEEKLMLKVLKLEKDIEDAKLCLKELRTIPSNLAFREIAGENSIDFSTKVLKLKKTKKRLH